MCKSRIGTVLCAIAMVLWFTAGTLFVKPAFAEEANGSLTLWCVKDDDIVSNMHWQLYRVGHREGNDYVFEGDFENYRATLGNKTTSMLEWDAETVASAGEALKRKTIADKIEKRDEGYTDSTGAVTFDGLENGLYLVWGDILNVGNTTYIPSAIFFEMNGEDAAVLNAYPKIVLRTLSEDAIQYSVRKVWLNDEDQPWNRSVSITVERYRDNAYYDEFELNASNDWTYEWEDTEDHIWFVYEKVIPDGYTVSYQENHTQYLIINTYDGFFDDSSSTDIQTTATTNDNWTDTNTTTTSTSQTTDDHSSETTPMNTTALHSSEASTSSTPTTHTTTTTTVATTVQTSTSDKAPQTGLLWWPVPALAVSGLLCFGVGLILGKKNDDE